MAEDRVEELTAIKVNPTQFPIDIILRLIKLLIHLKDRSSQLRPVQFRIHP